METKLIDNGSPRNDIVELIFRCLINLYVIIIIICINYIYIINIR